MQQPRRRILFVARRKLLENKNLYETANTECPSMEYRWMVYGCIHYPPTGLCSFPLVTGHRTLASLHSATLCLDLCVALCSLSHLTYFSPLLLQ
jgi:hypothetical protein